jgi:hypothetical protein
LEAFTVMYGKGHQQKSVNINDLMVLGAVCNGTTIGAYQFFKGFFIEWTHHIFQPVVQHF